MNLVSEFKRIEQEHKKALRTTAARVVLASSVTRVFESGTKKHLFQILVSVDVDEMPKFSGQDQFRGWFEQNLNTLVEVIKLNNPNNHRVNPGYKWGHGTKVLTLFLREIVLNRRYFSDAEMERISPWLYVPIDSVVMKRLSTLGCRLPFKAIKEIDTAEKFYGVQDLLGQAATKVGVPRVWFDDNWGDRQ